MATNTEEKFLREIEAHRNIIHKISRMYMNSTEDIKDLSQEIIIQLWRSYDSFRNESQFSTWMYKVALNTAITFFKREKRKANLLEIDESVAMIAESDSSDKKHKMAAFYKAVQLLNNIERALIFLYMEGQSHNEIAEKLGISEVNARVKLARTKEKLQGIIKQQDYEPR